MAGGPVRVRHVEAQEGTRPYVEYAIRYLAEEESTAVLSRRLREALATGNLRHVLVAQKRNEDGSPSSRFEIREFDN